MNPRVRRLFIAAFVIALCGLHTWMAASVSRVFSTTFDEIAHLTAGYTYWIHNDYRFQPENGNLPQRLAALPLLARDVAFPSTSGETWRTANVWRLGYRFFYESNNDLPSLLAAGRTMTAMLSGLLCACIFLWTRTLFGKRAAWLALLFAAFCPSLLAHGGLITSDTAAALGFLVATLAWWRLLHRISASRLLSAGLTAGFLAVSKYSVVLFAPLAAFLLLARLVHSTPLPVMLGACTTRISGLNRLPTLFGASVFSIGLCVTVIWAAYGFRYSAAPSNAPSDATFSRSWDYVLLNIHQPSQISSDPDHLDLTPGPVQHFVGWARDNRLLPEAWLYGLTFVETHSRGRMAYFSDEYRVTGWPSFFPTAFLVKTTLPALALIVLGMAGIALTPGRERRRRFYRLIPLLALVALYAGFSVTSKLNIGHRHLLPLYPALCVLAAGGAALLIRRHRAWLAVFATLTLWHVADSLRIRPDYLAYFNPIAGGPTQAHRLFVDSSLDWGQDLPRLKTWLDENAGDEHVYLSYFGTGSPLHTGIRATRIGDASFDLGPRSTVPELQPGLYCISATMFSQVYTGRMKPWSTENERDFQLLRRWLAHLRAQPAGSPPTWLDRSPLSVADTTRRLEDYELLLFARLCNVLEARQPVAHIGYSLRVFRLTSADLSGFFTSSVIAPP